MPPEVQHAEPPQLARKRGRPPRFEPTDADRRLVEIMSAGRMTHDEMAREIINPRSGKPITRDTLVKAFPNEIASGRARLKTLALSKAREALDRDEEWAIKWALRYTGVAEEAAAVNIGINYAPPEPVFVQARPQPDGDNERPVIEHQPAPSWQTNDQRPVHTASSTAANPNYVEPEPAPPPPAKEWTEDGAALFERDPRMNQYANELDALDRTPWYKKRLTGKLRKGPVLTAPRGVKLGWMK